MTFSMQLTIVFVVIVHCCLPDHKFCEAKLSLRERKEILHLHNVLRASVIPSASNMEKMVRVCDVL